MGANNSKLQKIKRLLICSTCAGVLSATFVFSQILPSTLFADEEVVHIDDPLAEIDDDGDGPSLPKSHSVAEIKSNAKTESLRIEKNDLKPQATAPNKAATATNKTSAMPNKNEAEPNKIANEPNKTTAENKPSKDKKAKKNSRKETKKNQRQAKSKGKPKRVPQSERMPEKAEPQGE